MAFTLPKDILQELSKRLATKPDTLSAMETAIAQRVRWCQRCEHYWVHRTRHEPRRCPNCGTTAWDLPLVDLIRKVVPNFETQPPAHNQAGQHPKEE